jgi:periplasmic nitrate reductase NapE
MNFSETNLRAETRGELRVFLFLAAVFAPLVTFLLVSGYGLLVWIWHMIHGPPGPAAH